MSLLSEREKMIMAGKAPAATRDELLQAAILESNERYEQNAKEIITALNRLEAAVRASNEQKVQNIADTLKNAATGVLAPFNAESENAVKRLSAAARRFDERSQGATIFGLSLPAIGVISLIALLSVLCYQVRELRSDVHDLTRMQQRIMWNVTYPDNPLPLGVTDADVSNTIENQWAFEREQRAKQAQQQ